MASWAKVDINGKMIGEETAFPPDSVFPSERITYKEKVFHNTGSAPNEMYASWDGNGVHIDAKYIPESPRGHWEFEAIGPKVNVVRSEFKIFLRTLDLS